MNPSERNATPADVRPAVAAPSEEPLIRDLLDGLGVYGPQLAQSIGLLAAETGQSVPPAHCMQACLGCDARQVSARGCAFLKSAQQQRVDPTLLHEGRCDRGFTVAAQPTTVGGRAAVLVTVAGQLAEPPARVSPPSEGESARHADAAYRESMPPAREIGAIRPEQLLAHLDAASRALQRFHELTEENAGFANEVLQTYEQLNLIFDLTQQIARVTNVQAIERLLVKRVARLLDTDAVALVDTADEFRFFQVGQPREEETEAMDAALPTEPGPLGGRPPAFPGNGGLNLPPEAPRLSVLNLPTAREIAEAPRDGGDDRGHRIFEPHRLAELVTTVRRSRCVQVASIDGVQVIVGPVVRLDDHVDVVIGERRPGRPSFQAGDMLLMESVLAFAGQIISNGELHERLRRMSIEVTRALIAAIDKKDRYTSNHSERGGFLTRLTAQELGVPPEEQQYMEWAGLLHDVGKIGIPEEILCKPGKLTEEEFAIIRQHPRMGYEILQPIRSFKHVLDGVLYHHEYPDGSGYPEGLKGDEIPLVARIIHVVDTFDALTSTRAYRKAFTVEKAIEMIRQEMGRRIDTAVAEAFFRALERFRRQHPARFAELFPNQGEQSNGAA